LPDAVPIHSRLKQVDALSSLLFNCALECAIRRDKENQKGFDMNGTHQPTVCTDYVQNYDIKKGESKVFPVFN
jgi:hypothetical protein